MSHLSRTSPSITTATLAITLSAFFLVSCGAGNSAENSPGDSATSTDSGISVNNCGNTITFDRAPERVTLLRSAAIPTLSHLGVLDRVTHRAGIYPNEYFDAPTAAAVASIPSLTDTMDSTGHLQISREAVVATGTDLILGQTSTVNPQTLASSAIPLIEEPTFCGDLTAPASWDNVWDHVGLYGTIFQREAAAKTYAAELQGRLADIMGDAPAKKPDGSPYRIAVLFPTVGGGVTYAYGNRSMATPVVAAAGAENVYDDVNDRVFEVTAEDIIARNPDIILALHSDGDSAPVVSAIKQIPGLDRTAAGLTSRIFPLLLNFAEPPTPLALDGLEQLNAYLRSLGSIRSPGSRQ